MTWSIALSALAGGALIGVASAILLLFNGRIAGVTGIFSGVLVPRPGEVVWRLWFLGGLVAGGALLVAFLPGTVTFDLTRTLPAMALAGALVGFGARLGGGCTSGHGVCGTGRLVPRSILATLTFMLTGGLVVYLVNHVLGGAL